MKTWVWPFSLYERIRVLEESEARLRAHNARLEADLRKAALQQTMMDALYITTVSSLCSSVLQQSLNEKP